jgi:hypothetical protein
MQLRKLMSPFNILKQPSKKKFNLIENEVVIPNPSIITEPNNVQKIVCCLEVRGLHSPYSPNTDYNIHRQLLQNLMKELEPYIIFEETTVKDYSTIYKASLEIAVGNVKESALQPEEELKREILAELNTELRSAFNRQATHTRDSGCMRGLKKAIRIVENIK